MNVSFYRTTDGIDVKYVCSVVLSGLAKPWMNEMISLITSVRDWGVAEMLI